MKSSLKMYLYESNAGQIGPIKKTLSTPVQHWYFYWRRRLPWQWQSSSWHDLCRWRYHRWRSQHLQDTTCVLVDEAWYSLHIAITTETTDIRLGDTLDVITKNPAITSPRPDMLFYKEYIMLMKLSDWDWQYWQERGNVLGPYKF